jgi:hypothetical protein
LTDGEAQVVQGLHVTGEHTVVGHGEHVVAHGEQAGAAHGSHGEATGGAATATGATATGTTPERCQLRVRQS